MYAQIEEHNFFKLKGTVSRNSNRDEPMEQKFRPKLMIADPFFCLKIGLLKATVRWVRYSVDRRFKTADFKTKRVRKH
jgi:hypothetical protein